MKYFKVGIGPLASGILFSLGLGVSGMTEAKNIIAFLDILRKWQPELILVMITAILVYGFLFKLITKKTKPLFEESFSLPTQKLLNKRLILGAILFGIGWGITGLCPGPGITSLVSGSSHAFVFVITMILGMILGRSSFVGNFSQK